jgi:hypothetical protein
MQKVDLQIFPRSVFDGEPDFDCYLPAMHLSLINLAARFDHLEPTQISDGFVSAFYSFFNGILRRGGGGAGKFNEFVNVVFHIR